MRGSQELLAIVRRPWLVIAVVGAVAFTAWAVASRRHDHHVRVALAEAFDLGPGMDVRIHGRNVGRISRVDLQDGRPIVELGIDGDAWPLRAGTRAVARWGTTVGLGERRIDLLPGPRTGAPIPEGGAIPAHDTVLPTELDDVFQTLDAPTRRHLQALMRRWHGTVRGRARVIGEGVSEGSRALASTGGVLRDLAADARALDVLVVDADRVAHTLASRSGRIRSLVSVAATTFDVLARNARDLERSVAGMPSTLRQSRRAFARLDSSLAGFRRLAAALAPGARRMPALTRTLRAAVGELRSTAPTGVRALRSLRAGAPDVRRLLRAGVPLVQEVDPALRQGLPVIRCLRPYAPEFAGVLANWAGYTSNFDGNGHYARVAVALGTPTAIAYPPGLSTQAFTRLTGVRYMGPRPPGWLAGKPRYDASCGVGRDVTDPRADWDDRG